MKAMINEALRKIGANLPNGRAKIFFGPIGKEGQAEIFSYLRELVKGSYPDTEFFEGGKIAQFKSSMTENRSGKRVCLLVEDIFERGDFPVLINQAYGNKNIILIGISRFGHNAVDYGKMTTIGGRYESYFLFAQPFSPETNFVSYLSKGSRSFDGEGYLEGSLSRIAEEAKTRKKEDVRKLYDFIVCSAGKPLSIREMSSSLPSPLSPHTVSKYLDAYVDHFLIYRLEAFDLMKMRLTGGRFRLYPYDTSLYRYGTRETAEKIDLLSMTPLIARLKEEGYECFHGQMNRQKMQPDGSRKYECEDIGVYAVNGKRKLLFVLNIGGEKKIGQSLLRLSPAIRKYVLESGNSKEDYDDNGICHIGVEYVLGEEFDWRRSE